MTIIAGQAAQALSSLNPAQLSFIQNIPKSELHAHLNGSIPLQVLQKMARDRGRDLDDDERVSQGLTQLANGVQLEEIGDFFGLFTAIYALTDRADAVRIATHAVLESFLLGDKPQCTYLELRTTPRQTKHLTKKEYILAVLFEVEKYDPEQVSLLLSVDRRMSQVEAEECVSLAIELRRQGKRVVGIDLCGDPTGGPLSKFTDAFRRAKVAGLGITLHIGETPENTSEDTQELLSFLPNRVGHATFLNEDERKIICDRRIGVEICLSSNLICKTVQSLDAHHIRHYLRNNSLISICTDDTLPFRTSLLAEYALLIAAPPMGLGLSEDEIRRIAKMGADLKFCCAQP